MTYGMTKRYDRVVGYAAPYDVDVDKLRSKILIVKMIVERYFSTTTIRDILVAGCGDGREAMLMKDIYSAKVEGVDISLPVGKVVNGDCVISRQDLSNLDFEEGSFDFAYSYHVLEHVLDPMAVLREVHRVLRPGGILFIGFPNKNRVVAYIGTHNSTTLSEKIKWNLNDWWKRFTGKFENHLGAHAGFREQEYLESAGAVFPRIISVRDQYMMLKYPEFERFIKVMTTTGVDEYLFPSNYYLCFK